MRKFATGAGAALTAALFLWMLLTLLALQQRSVQAEPAEATGVPDSEIQSGTGLTPTVRLNEVMVANRSAIQDKAGDWDSWVELYNDGLLPLDVGGMGLNNQLTTTTLWLIPTGTVIPAGGYLLIWADGEPDEGPLHAGFVLTAGQAITLFDKSVFGHALIDSFFVTGTPTDHVWARVPDGYGDWQLLDMPSPGATNATHKAFLPLIVRSAQAQPPHVFVNELMAANASTLADEWGEYDDWIELYNPGPDNVSVGGLYLSDELGDLPRWQIPAGTVISAGGYLLLWADGQPEQGPLHTNFKLSSAGEWLALVESDGFTLLDWVTFTAQLDDVSLGRLPDGFDRWVTFDRPTPGSANLDAALAVVSTTLRPVAPGVSDTVTVTTRLKASYPPLSVTLYHDGWGATTGTLRPITATPMTALGEGLYRARIPPQPDGTIVHYYVRARDALSLTVLDPPGAPSETYAYEVGLPVGTLVINELMADNHAVVSDTLGEFDDWIELYNAGPITLDLGGFYLTNDLDQPTMWQIPTSTTLAPGRFLLLWADGQPEQGPLHANFDLDAAGGAVGLFGHGGEVAVDALDFAAQTPDVSLGRYPDGGDLWFSMGRPTPGDPNIPPDPPHILTVAYTLTAPVPGTAVTVTALVTDDNAVLTVALEYDAGAGFTPAPMWDDGLHGDGLAGDGFFGGQIPGQPDRAVVYFYVRAWDDEGLTATAPVSAPVELYRYRVGGGGLPLYVNEFMADNRTVISDTAGEFDDWIELYNAGPTPVRLGGLYLSDDLRDARRWRIPDGVVIPPDGHLLFWADDDIEQGDDHTNFRLSAGGEDVALFDADLYGNGLVDGLSYPALDADVSYGRSGDGGPTWRVFTTPTPGGSNPL